MKPFLVLYFFLMFLSTPLFSKTLDLASILQDSFLLGNKGVTRALVVGISDYQSPKIPDLKFAHKDAEAFSDWLRSAKGGNVPADNIITLLNEKATNAAVGIALFQMIDFCQPGDQFLFYFSGHGDTETKTSGQPGYLLTYDSPPNVYMIGALNLRDLQAIISTLSEKQVKVTLISDACHSGKLAGSDIEGTQATTAALSRQFANEVKIMSCQPNEFSLEGEQWGNGRGVFSWHLLDGLTGLADKNEDGIVNLLEINHYLQDMVTAEAAPHNQTPFTVGNLQTHLAYIDAASLNQLEKERAGQLLTMSKTGSKGLEEDILNTLDPATKQKYYNFKKALEERQLLEPEGICANDLFETLMTINQLSPLHGIMTRNFAISLIDEVQQALNAILSSDPYEANNWRYNTNKYLDYPKYLQRAIELLSEQHYMYRSLMCKKKFFEGYNNNSLTSEDASPEVIDSVRQLSKGLYLEALSFDSTAAYVYQSIASLYSWNSPSKSDSLISYNKKAIQFSPKWLLPYLDIATEFGLNNEDLVESEKWLKEAIALSPESYVVMERLSWLYQWQNKTEESLELCRKMIAAKPDLFNAYSTMGVTHCMRKEYAEAEAIFNKSIAIDPNPNGNWAYTYQPCNIINTRRINEAVEWSEKFLVNDTIQLFMKSNILNNILQTMLSIGEIEKANHYARRLEKLDLIGPHTAIAHFVQGLYKAENGYEQDGLAMIKQANEMGEIAILQIEATKYLAILAWRKGHIAKADSLFRIGNSYDLKYHLDDRNSKSSELARFEYGYFLLQQNKKEKARALFEKNIALEPKSYSGYYGMALLMARNRKKQSALDYLEQALNNWYPKAAPILEEPLFRKIRRTKRFKLLMKKHFPEVE